MAANGIYIRDGHGTGDVVTLRGVNLGGWLTMEAWMVPMDSSGLPDNYSVIQTLDNRAGFGVAREQALITTFQENWITTTDLDNIRAMGMNLIRLPVWWGNFQTLSGTWRTDAFSKIDWLVTNAWQRGIYTIIDLHGVPGGQSMDQSTGRANQNQYWTNLTDQSQTVLIWTNIATHFNGYPGVAGYDLINEPNGAPSSSAVWNAYNSLYQAIRAVDPDHMIFMEGTWGAWNWSMLPPPSTFGWSNVVYEMHEYQWGSVNNPSGVMAGVDNQVSDFKNHQSWNVPAYIGEFNGFRPGSNPTSVWQYAVRQFNTNNMSWSTWTYKAIHGTVPDGWGVYDPVGTWPPTPNIQSDSRTTISNDWSRWTTSSAFAINPMLRTALGGPLAIPDSYNATSGVALAVNSNAGVLANDQDINLGQPGIQLTAVWVDGPSHGQLTLNANGSFTYTAAAGFSGTDTFRYRVFDGYVNSVNIAMVTIQVSASVLTAFQQWQERYFTSTNSPVAASTANPDGDGMDNWQEFLTGTDPTNSASYFHITSLVPTGNDMQVSWMCGSGTTNVLQSAAVPSGPYSNITSNIILVGSGVTTTNYVDAGAFTTTVAVASDNASAASYAGGNLHGANGGSGLGAWVTTPPTNTTTAGWFIRSSTGNGSAPSGEIDSVGGNSWGSYASGGATASVVRAFSSGPLAVGEVFSIDMDNGWIEAGNSVGFDLQNSSGQTMLEVSYIGFNAAGSYSATDATGQHTLGVPYTDGGLHVQITLTADTTYSATIIPAGGSPVAFNGNLMNPPGGQGISQIRLFNNNAAAGNSGPAWEAFWNNLQITNGPAVAMRYYRVLLVP